MERFHHSVDYFAYLYPDDNPDASVNHIFSIAYMVVGLFCLILIIFYSHKSEAHVRINVGLGLFIVSLLVVPLMDVFYIKGRVGSILRRFAATIASNEHSSSVALLKNMARFVLQVMVQIRNRGRTECCVCLCGLTPSPSTVSRPPAVPAAKTPSWLCSPNGQQQLKNILLIAESFVEAAGIRAIQALKDIPITLRMMEYQRGDMGCRISEDFIKKFSSQSLWHDMCCLLEFCGRCSAHHLHFWLNDGLNVGLAHGSCK
ncbi:hypothetical protein ACFX14_042895 [Malus domestica]